LPRSRPGIHNRGDPQKKAHQMPELQEDIKRQGVQGQKVWTEVLALSKRTGAVTGAAP